MTGDAELANTLGAILEGEGYRVFKAYDGHEGLKLIDAMEPDLVILDLKMPKCHGAGVYNALRQRNGSTRFPIVIMSGCIESSQIYDDFPVRKVYQKPMHIPDFLMDVRNILVPGPGRMSGIDKPSNPDRLKQLILQIRSMPMIVFYLSVRSALDSCGMPFFFCPN